MANDVIVTIIGHTTGPAELRFTPSGAAVANLSVAVTPRSFDKQTNEWKDGATTFYRVNAWRSLAENVGETLIDKGMKVVVTGRLENRPYEKDGVTKYSLEITADEIGPALSNATAVVTKASKQGGGQQAAQGRSQGSGGGGWGGGGQQQSSGGWGGAQGQSQAAAGAWGA